MSFTPPSLIPALWSGRGTKAALAAAREALLRVRPPAVMPHSAPSALARDAPEVVEELRRLLPGVRIWLGVGMDAGFEAWASGRMSDDELHERRVRVADTAVSIGAEAVCWNAERRWKLDANVPKQGTGMFGPEGARRLLADVRARHPGLHQSHSAYQRPWHHRAYRWQGWLGAGGGADSTYSQVYWASKTGAPRDTGPRFLETHRGLYDRCVRAGLIAPREACPEHVYLQSYGCDAYDLSRVADKFASVAVWAFGTSIRQTPATLALWAALAEIDRRGFAGPGRVAAFQRHVGLVADAKIGPKTLFRLGLGPPVPLP